MHRREASTFISHEFYVTQGAQGNDVKDPEKWQNLEMLFCWVEQRGVVVKKEVHHVRLAEDEDYVQQGLFVQNSLFSTLCL